MLSFSKFTLTDTNLLLRYIYYCNNLHEKIIRIYINWAHACHSSDWNTRCFCLSDASRIPWKIKRYSTYFSSWTIANHRSIIPSGSGATACFIRSYWSRMMCLRSKYGELMRIIELFKWRNCSSGSDRWECCFAMSCDGCARDADCEQRNIWIHDLTWYAI